LLAVKAFADLVEALNQSVICLGFLDHTLDGIFDVVGLFLFDGLLGP
jgi:hypothetical protein